MPDSHLVLLADVGGTNTRVALAQDGVLVPDSIRRFANAGRPGLEAILTEYLAEAPALSPSRASLSEAPGGLAGACIAAAGPVRDGRAVMTNLRWTIAPEAIGAAIGVPAIAVLNDLQAQGHALGHIAPDMLHEILPGSAAHPGESQLVIGIGTGFNAAPVHEAPGGRIVAASECGHISLPAHGAQDLRLVRFIETHHGFASVEEVLSGRGLLTVHDFVRSEAGQGEKLDAMGLMAAIAQGDPLAEETARIFVRLMGRVAGDLALIHLPYGGLYLIGGVARAFAPHLSRFGFAEAFQDRGRFSDFLGLIPVRIIADDYAALVGCAAFMRSQITRMT